MMKLRPLATLAFATALLLAGNAFAQQSAADAARRYDPAFRTAEQKSKLQRFAYMDGTWRGPATYVLPDGSRHDIIQTERIGPLLGGAIKLIEGRGYNPDGTTGFNAFAVLSWDVDAQAYGFRSHAMGFSGDMKFAPTDDGFVWEIPAGPGTVIRYTAVVKDGTWHEVGERIGPDGQPARTFEMTLKRIGDSAWPTAGAVPPR